MLPACKMGRSCCQDLEGHAMAGLGTAWQDLGARPGKTGQDWARQWVQFIAPSSRAVHSGLEAGNIFFCYTNWISRKFINKSTKKL
jgi:hypothetical protein